MTDIMDRARELRQRVNWSSNEAVQHIADALLAAEQRGAERQREADARLAETFDGPGHIFRDGALPKGWLGCRNTIAAAIRGQPHSVTPILPAEQNGGSHSNQEPSEEKMRVSQ